MGGHRARVPPRGRQLVARLLRRQEARSRSTASTSACSTSTTFIEACQPWLTGDRAPWPPDSSTPRCSPPWRRWCRSGSRCCPRCRRTSTSSSCATPRGRRGDVGQGHEAARGGRRARRHHRRLGARGLVGREAQGRLRSPSPRRSGLKPGKAGAPVRVAVTGRTVGPPLYEALELLGREVTLSRLRAARARLEPADPLLARDPTRGPARRPAVAGEALTELLPGAARGRRWSRRRSWCLGVIARAGAAGRLLRGHAGPGVAGRAPGPAHPADAIVVLGAAQYDGRPSPQLAARLDHALDLWNEGLAPTIVVTGGKQPGDRFTEAEASADYLIERGVPETRSCARSRAQSSWESLAAAARFLHDRGMDDGDPRVGPVPRAADARHRRGGRPRPPTPRPTRTSPVTGVRRVRQMVEGGRRRRHRPAHRLPPRC